MTKVKKESKDYSRAYRERQEAKRIAMGIVDVSIPLSITERAMVDDICKRDGFNSVTEMLAQLIRNAHAGAPVTIPPIGYVPKEKHLAKIGKPCNPCNNTGELPDGSPCKRCSA